MKALISSLSLTAFIACQPPWQYPHGRIETRALHKQELYEFIKSYHDRKHTNDHMNLVYQATILKNQQNGMGSLETWVIGTEQGSRFEYLVQVAVYLQGGNYHSIYGEVGYAIIEVKELPKVPN